MINWFNMPAEGLSNGGQFEIKELTATENKTYEKDGEVYNKVTVNVSGGGGSSDFSTATVTYETDQIFPLYMARADDLMEGLNPSVKTDGEYIVPLYKGKAFAIWSRSIEDLEIETTGDITYDSEHNVFIITGDGTISIF